jgi:capsular polysaccharide transport system permease protein
MRHGTVITVRDGEQDLLRGLKRQSSVIMAIIFKDIKVRQRTSKFGIFYVLIEPMVFILAIASIRYLFRTTSVDGLHVMIWVPLGVSAFLLFRRCISKVPMAIKSNEGLLDYPQVKPIDPVIAMFILEMTLTMIASGLAIFLIWWVMGVGPSFPRPLETIGVVVALLAGSFGVALVLAVYGTFYENIPRTIRFLNRPLIFISGVIFSVSALPAYIREYLAWNPLLQFIEYIRLYAAGHPTFPEGDLFYACLVSISMLGVGFIAYYANRYRLVQSR